MMIKYYSKSFDMGNIEGYGYIGDYYKENKIYDKMREWYQTGINNKDARSMNNLGSYYEDIKDDICEALRCYKLAEDWGNLQAQWNLIWLMIFINIVPNVNTKPVIMI